MASNEVAIPNAVIILFTVAALAYLALGFSHYIDRTGRNYDSDLKHRWSQQLYVTKGVNPFFTREGSLSSEEGTQLIDPEIGPSVGVSYPPWSYVINEVLIPPLPWTAVTFYFAAWLLIVLVVQGIWVWHQGIPYGRRAAWMLCWASLALYSNFMAIGLGQLSNIMIAAIIAWMYFSSQERPVLAGIFLFIALVKPQLTLFLLFVPLVRRDWKCLLTTGLLGLVSTGAISLWFAEPPHELLLQVLNSADEFEIGLLGIPGLLMRFGLVSDPNLLSPIGLVSFGFLALVLSFRHRDAPLPVIVTIPIVFGQMWTYSRRYDQNLLVFLLVALCLLALARGTRWDWALFGSLFFVLWAPVDSALWHITEDWPVFIISLVGLASLLQAWRSGSFPTEVSNSTRLTGSV